MSNKVITFGCRLNEYESQLIKADLEQNQQDNCLVINTCSVTQEAIKKAKNAIILAKKAYPTHKIIVTGCAAQIQANVFANMSEVHAVLGNKEKLSLSQSLKANNDLQIDPSLAEISPEKKISVSNIMREKKVGTEEILVSNFEGRTRAFVQIQNGCNHRCTFCIIPYARGNNRSIEISKIYNQINKFTDSGYQEIVFTGVDITDYGKDLPNKPTLAQIIKRILNLCPTLHRLRLSSVDVAEIDNDLFNLMSTEERLMPHMHISLQAGDNTILQRMRRRHQREQVIDFCKSLRAARKDIAFGADIIAGFPTETDEMFLNTYSLIDEAGLQYLHIFPYSAHPNTPAYYMPQNPQDVIHKRAKILRNKGKECLNKFLTNQIGKYTTVLIEKDNKGYSANFIKTFIPNNAQNIHNTIALVKLDKVVDSKIQASIVQLNA
jgi:threonylcarbamoyladenosine tRNA methylthiotransferase MtaB